MRFLRRRAPSLRRPRAIERRRGNFVALNRGPSTDLWGFGGGRYALSALSGGVGRAGQRRSRGERLRIQAHRGRRRGATRRCCLDVARGIVAAWRGHIVCPDGTPSRRCRERSPRLIMSCRTPRLTRPRICAGERLDDPHPAAAARAWRRLDGCLGLIGAADAFGFSSPGTSSRSRHSARFSARRPLANRP